MSEIYQTNQLSIYLAQEITWARYINQIHFRYILLEKLLERDMSTKSIFYISCSRNYLSKIYQPIPFLIYLAWEITLARYSNKIYFWYISVKKLLEPDISIKSIFDISPSRNYLNKIYQPNSFLIYLAQEITWARYINQIYFRYILLEKLLKQNLSMKSIFDIYILLEKFLERDISTKLIFDLFCSRNYLSKVYEPNPFSIYLAREITWARYINQINFQFISLEKLLEWDLPTKSIFDLSRSRYYLSKIYQPNSFLFYFAREITWARFINQILFWYISLNILLELDI